MNTAKLALALGGLGALIAVLIAVMVLHRLRRRAAARRRERRMSPVRPVLLSLASGDEADEADWATLLSLPSRTWHDAERDIVDLLSKVRGDGRAALVSVLQRKGSLEQALRQVRSRRSLRRAAAAELLGVTGSVDGVDVLLRLLDDRNAYVRLTSARALGRLAAPAAAGPLLHCLRTPGRVPTVVLTQALLGIGVPAQSALIDVLDDESDLLRSVAVEVLGLTGALSASGSLCRLVESDASPDVRLRAAVALGRLGLPSVAPVLINAAETDSEIGVRTAAVRALGELGDRSSIGHLTGLLHAPAVSVAAAAAESLVALAPEGLTALQQVDFADPSAKAAAHARAALSRAALRGFTPEPASARRAELARP